MDKTGLTFDDSGTPHDHRGILNDRVTHKFRDGKLDDLSATGHQTVTNWGYSPSNYARELEARTQVLAGVQEEVVRKPHLRKNARGRTVAANERQDAAK